MNEDNKNYDSEPEYHNDSDGPENDNNEPEYHDDFDGPEDDNSEPEYHDDFDETVDENFEIGIPVNETLSHVESNDDPSEKTMMESDKESDPADDHIDAEVENDIPEDRNLCFFHEIMAQLQNLSKAFESKLKYDEHKNKIIDDLHRSLQEYRDNLVKKYLHRIIIDMIKIVDDMRKFANHHKNQADIDIKPEKLLKYIENVASDIEDLFSWEGVMPFTCEGEGIDLSRQRIINKIRTADPEKDKTLAERMRPGYEWDGKIIRPEMISAYIYQKEESAEDNNI